MRRKIILFSVGLGISVGLFCVCLTIGGHWGAGLFTRTGGPHGGVGDGATPEWSSGSAITTPRVESRSNDGTLEYLLEAERADPDPGVKDSSRFILAKPRATYFVRNRWVVVVTADRGVLESDPIRTKNGKPMPKSGSLIGNVVLRAGPAEAMDKPGSDGGQVLRATLTKPVEFDYARRELESAGAIHVRHERVEFDGEHLTASFNMDQKRVEYLRIERGDKFVVRRVSEQMVPRDSAAPATGATTTATAGAGAVGAMTAGAPATGKTTSPAYRLVLNTEVKAVLGQRNVTTDTLRVAFQSLGNEVAQKATSKPAEAEPGAVAPIGVGTTMAAATTPVVAPIAPVGEDDLVVTWKGPLELRPAGEDVKLAGPKDMHLEFVGTAERPVVIVDGPEREARAGRLVYQTASQRAELEPGTHKVVELGGQEMGRLVCQGLTFDELARKVHMTGPGELTMAEGVMRENGAGAGKKSPTVAKWSKALDVLLAPGESKGKKNAYAFVIKHATLTGEADVRDPASFWIHSDVLDAAVAQTTVAGAKAGETRQGQTLEHLLATGGVTVHSYSGPGGVEKPDTITGKTLEVKTAVTPGSGGPRPSEFIVDGEAVALRYEADKGDARKLHRQQISTPRLVALLEPKAQDAKAGTVQDAARDAFGGVAVKQFAGAGGVKVELENFGDQSIVATAETLVADPKKGTAQLAAKADQADDLVRLRQGENYIVGRKVLLDRETQALEIPGSGNFTFAQPTKKADEQPLKINVAWQTSMKYSGVNREASFTGPVLTKLLDRPGQTSEMTAERLRVKFVAANKAGGAKSEGVGGQRPSEIWAEGDVRAFGMTLDAKGAMETRMLLQKVDTLVYDDAKQALIIKGKGQMLMEDNRPAPAGAAAGAGPGAGGSRGKTAFSWVDGLTYVAESGEIRVLKDVVMVHEPTQPLQLQMPGGKGGKAQTADRVTLQCQDLKAFVASAKAAATGPATTTPAVVVSPLALGANGQMRLTKVIADTRTQLDVGSDQIIADLLEFDVERGLATGIGREGRDVEFVREEMGHGRAQKVVFNLKTGEWDAPGAQFTGTAPEIKP